MHHQRRPHAGAQVGRALGEKTKPVVKGEMELGIEQGIKLVGQIVRLLQPQPRLHDLDADMILLAEHNADRLVLFQQQCPPLAVFSELGADEVPLGQRLRLHVVERVHFNVFKILLDGRVAAQQSVTHLLAYFLSLVEAHPVGEGHPSKIAGQPHAGADNHIPPLP